MAKRIHPDAAVTDLAQVRIEGGVKQPEGFIKLGARKDIVIWRKPFQTAWDKDFQPIRSPWVVMEWKVTRSLRPKTSFNAHDEEWILGFTRENPKSLGYVVSVDFLPDTVQIRWKKAKNGKFQ